MTRTLPIILALALASPAHAFDDFHFGDKAPPSYRKAPKRHHRPAPAPAKVKGWIVRPAVPPIDIYQPPEAICLAPVMVDGIQGITERGAEEKARDAWSAKVRASLGERFMDLRFAKRFLKSCNRSSVGDNPFKSIREKVQEKIGIDEDGADANDAAEYRCRIWAIPCEPRWMTRGEDVKRDVEIEEPYIPPPPGHGPLTSRRKWILQWRAGQ